MDNDMIWLVVSVNIIVIRGDIRMELVINFVDAKIESNHPWSIWLIVSIPRYDNSRNYGFRFTGTDIEEYFFSITDLEKEKIIRELQELIGYGKYDLKSVKQIIARKRQLKISSSKNDV